MTTATTITVHSLIVAVCWFVGMVIAVLNLFIDAPLEALCLVFIGAGATLYTKGCIEKANADWIEAYETGREVARIRSASRSLS